jgi:hypothetical protein
MKQLNSLLSALLTAVCLGVIAGPVSAQSNYAEDRATATAYWFHMGNDNPDRSAQLNSFGHYEDELRKVNGEWLFSLRKIYNEQVAEWAAGQDNPVVHPSDGPGLRQTQ